jgi:hypothetical protein
MRLFLAAAGTTALLGLAAIPAYAGAVSAPAHQHKLGAAATAAGGTRSVSPALPPDVHHLSVPVNLQPTASGTWVGVLEVTLPQPGTYILDANVHGRLWGKPPVNAVIYARLWNVTTNSLVPDSTRTINHLADSNTEIGQIGQRATAPISEEVTVTGPTTIRLQAARVNQSGASTYADILSGTSLRFARV